MPNKTNIEWADYSSNPFYVTRKSDGKRGWHCDKPSPGCGHCYAETLNKRFGTGLPFLGRNGQHLNFHVNDKELTDIIKLSARLAKKGETASIFPCDMTDMFLLDWPGEFLDKYFAAAALSPNLTHLILTKRPRRMVGYLQPPSGYTTRMGPIIESMENDFGYLSRESVSSIALPPGSTIGWEDPDFPFSNVILGCSVENQEYADLRREPMRQLSEMGWRTFVSYEPALESVDWTGWEFLDWMIMGGESGHGARPCDIEWFRSTISFCREHGIPPFVKQFGAQPVQRCSNCGRMVGNCLSGMVDSCGISHSLLANETFLKSHKGNDMDEWPEDLRIRKMPIGPQVS